jgi:hypothetical protein
MAAISLTDFKRYFKHEGEVAEVFLISPATADSADTVDITPLLAGRNLVDLSGWDTTTGDSVTATYNASTDVVTIDAAGGTTNHVYALRICML